MFRRSRFSVRPNVGATGRTAATPKEPASVNPEESANLVAESSAAVTDSTSVVAAPENSLTSGDGNDPAGDAASSSAAVQRRKRFSIKPKVAPGRPSATTRTNKAVFEKAAAASTEDSGTNLDTEEQSGTVPQTSQSPGHLTVLEDGKQCSEEPEKSLTTDKLEEETQTAKKTKKELPPRPPDKVPLSIPDRETTELSEKAKSLMSKPMKLPSLPRCSLSRLLNDPSDVQKIEKTRKLRELLRREMHKEKNKHRRPKYRVKEFSLDPAKMTMRDLLHYFPTSNPMASSLEETTLENETILPNSPERAELPEKAKEPEAKPVSRSDEDEEEAAGEEEEQDEGTMVPRVKVAEDGSLIIDEESLTVEVLRQKGPNPADDKDPIFERGSTTTYSSFRKGTHTKPWSSEETDMFYLAISMVGTDFSMICQLFTHRARAEIKNKFKKEERENSWRIDKAFRERRKLDLEYFTKLLEKVLEVQKNKKKKTGSTRKTAARKRDKKTKEKAVDILSDVEEEEEEEEEEDDDILDLVDDDEEEGEKENEDLGNDGGTLVSTQKGKRKRKSKTSSDEGMAEKRNRKEKTNEQDKVSIPEDTEATLPEEHTTSVQSENDEGKTAPKSAAIKPAKLSRAPKPLLPLGKKWSKKLPTVSAQTDAETTEKEKDEGSHERQADETRTKEADSSDDEECTVLPPKPTRSGRMPKPIQHLSYTPKEDSSSETNHCPPARASATAPKPRQKRGRESQSAPTPKKTKLVTLTASQSDDSDDLEEEEEELSEQGMECSPGKESSAPAFVPASLRSARVPEEVETIEELDILASIPNVLDMTHENETGTTEPEHQLDLLLDVIDLLSSGAPGVSDESYNEAAQTLLTIGNLTNVSQLNETVPPDQPAEETPVAGRSNDVEENLPVGGAGEEQSATASPSLTAEHKSTEPQITPTIINDEQSSEIIPDIESTFQTPLDPGTPVQNVSQPTRGRLHKVKPNLSRTSRAVPSKSQPTREKESQDPPEESKLSAKASSDVIVEGEAPTVECVLEPSGLHLEQAVASTSHVDATEEVASDGASSDLTSSTKNTKLIESFSGVDSQLNESVISGAPQSQSTPLKRGCLHKVKPKPNLARASRTGKSAEETQPNQETPITSHASAQALTSISAEHQHPNPSHAPSELITSGVSGCTSTHVSVDLPVGDTASRSEPPTSTEEAQSQETPLLKEAENPIQKPPETHLEPTPENTPDVSDHMSTETQMELQITDANETADDKCSEGKSNPEITENRSPLTRRGRLSRIKPKPNLERASKTAPAKSLQSSNQEAPTTSHAGQCSLELLKDDARADNPIQIPAETEKLPTVEPATSSPDGSGHVATETCTDIETHQKAPECSTNMDLIPQVLENPEITEKSSQPTRKRFSRLKPKPNLKQALKSDPVASPESGTLDSTPDASSTCRPGPECSIPAVVPGESRGLSEPAGVSTAGKSMTSAESGTSCGHNGGTSTSLGQNSRAEPTQESPGATTESVEPAHPVRKSRVQVKPNLAQTSRAVRTKAQSKEDPSPSSQPMDLDRSSSSLVSPPGSTQALPEKLNSPETTERAGKADCSSMSLDLFDLSQNTSEVTTDQVSVSETASPSCSERGSDPARTPQVDKSSDAAAEEKTDLVVSTCQTEGCEVESHRSTSQQTSVQMPKPDPAHQRPAIGKPHEDTTPTSTPGSSLKAAPADPQSNSPEKTTTQRRRIAKAKPNLGPSAQAREPKVRGKVVSAKTESLQTSEPPVDTSAQASLDQITVLPATRRTKKEASREVVTAAAQVQTQWAVGNVDPEHVKKNTREVGHGEGASESVGSPGETTPLLTENPPKSPSCDIVQESREAKEEPSSEPTRKSADDSSKKANPTRRGRLKPKPDLGCSSRAALAAEQTEAESVASSNPEPEVQPDTPVPASTAAGQMSSVAEFQSLFPDMLSVPLDPDEPFFVLSLTAVPVCPAGEVKASESVSYLPTADASERQRSGESLPVEGDVSPLNVPVEPTPVSVQSPHQDLEDRPISTSEKPERPLEEVEDAAVQPDERHAPARTQTRSRAKRPEVKPETKQRSRARRGKVDRSPRQAGPSTRLQPTDHEQEVNSATVTSSPATSSPLREPKVSVDSAPHESPIPAKRAVPRSRRTVASVTKEREAASVATTSRARTGEETRVEPSPPAEVSLDCAADEATGVSQYFLSDIFTEVEET